MEVPLSQVEIYRELSLNKNMCKEGERVKMEKW